MSDSAAPVNEALTASAEEIGVKCFVGNISFSTTSEDLKEAFSKAGEVIDAQVISRGKRSLGYAFVAFKNEDDASKAVSQFDKSTLKERTINVEIAKPAKHAPGGGLPKAAAEAAQQAGLGDEHQSGRRGRGRPRRGAARRVQPDGEADAAGVVENGVDGAEDGAAALSTGTRGGKPRRGRGRPQPRGPPAGEPSTTLLFVANLPFQLDSDGLKEVFKDYKVTSAHVVTRKYGATAGKSKGFGFVEVENEEEQKRAVQDLNGKSVDTPAGARELSVKVAINAESRQGQDGVDNDTEVTVTATSAADAAGNA